MSDIKHVKYNLHYVRKYVFGESQEKFAERVNISVDTVSNIERGKVVPTLQNLVSIANAVGKPVDYFLNERNKEVLNLQEFLS
ncbi:MAG: helix-turn-helix transcriptional regulator [Clostridia bacterium]|nr:helix-turn-helix transcriptional regulator [Clostridia bacterium]